MKTFCKFVNELEKNPKDVIMLLGKDVTLAEFFKAEGIATPETVPQPPPPFYSAEEGDDVDDGGTDNSEGAGRRDSGVGGWPSSFGTSKSFVPAKFMGGVTKRSTHIKPYLEAYNRYTTAERRRLRGDPVTCVCMAPCYYGPYVCKGSSRQEYANVLRDQCMPNGVLHPHGNLIVNVYGGVCRTNRS
jgi:hypothetical protein